MFDCFYSNSFIGVTESDTIDTMNNVEMVRFAIPSSIDGAAATLLSVTVLGVSVPSAPQPFALVVTQAGGVLTEVECPTVEPCICSRLSSGCDVVSGACICEPGWRGDFCEVEICPSQCSGHGACVAQVGCACDPGFFGNDCALSKCSAFSDIVASGIAGIITNDASNVDYDNEQVS